MGELLPKLIKHGGDEEFRKSNDLISELEELGISAFQSSRYQQLAKIRLEKENSENKEDKKK